MCQDDIPRNLMVPRWRNAALFVRNAGMSPERSPATFYVHFINALCRIYTLAVTTRSLKVCVIICFGIKGASVKCVALERNVGG